MAEEEKSPGQDTEKGADRIRAYRSVEAESHWDRLVARTEEDRIALLDPICKAVNEVTDHEPWNTSTRIVPNRIFALAVLDLYERWNLEMLTRP